ncbi:MAG: rhomboid family intramembrane serine protease, partial [Kiritimatiellae bacterium]|nr:rhomboid family intramembrane serine protease [Kiritimatiellia bacterium]
MIPIRDNVPARFVPFVTYFIILANVLVYIHQSGLDPVESVEFAQLYGTVPARFTHAVWATRPGFPPEAILTLFTSMFLHGGFFHLFSNMWALWLFGDNVEDRLGHLRYLLFYILCGVLAMLTHVLVNPASRIPAVGASGAIAGVMGAYMIHFPRAGMIVMMPLLFYPMFFEVPAVFYLLLWFIGQLASGTGSLLIRSRDIGGVAFWAHIGGFVAG